MITKTGNHLRKKDAQVLFLWFLDKYLENPGKFSEILEVLKLPEVFLKISKDFSSSQKSF